MTVIRAYQPSDWPDLWDILEPVFRSAETYAVAPDISAEDARRYWTELPLRTYVAEMDDGQLAGTYYLKTNQPGPGAHVCNCGYIVAPQARGQGIATQLCEHSQAIARQCGYEAMQYNFVASTNAAAVRLWLSHGFEIAGRLPGAFRHPQEGKVDAYVMYKTL